MVQPRGAGLPAALHQRNLGLPAAGGAAGRAAGTPPGTDSSPAGIPGGPYAPFQSKNVHVQLPCARDKSEPNRQAQCALQGGCRYRVGAVFLWSTGGSWDVIGLSSPVYGDGGGFRVEAAVDIIAQHNEEARILAEEASEGDEAGMTNENLELPSVMALDGLASSPSD